MSMQLHNDGLANGAVDHNGFFPTTTIDQQTLIDGLNENLVFDREMFYLVTRLQQIEQESDLLTSQRQGLQRQLRAMEMARDGRRTPRARPTSGRTVNGFLEQAPVPVAVGEAPEELFPCSDAPAQALANNT